MVQKKTQQRVRQLANINIRAESKTTKQGAEQGQNQNSNTHSSRLGSDRCTLGITLQSGCGNSVLIYCVVVIEFVWVIRMPVKEFLADSGIDVTEFPWSAHSGSSVPSRPTSRMRAWAFQMLGTKFLEEDGVKNLMCRNPSLCFWTVDLPLWGIPTSATWIEYGFNEINWLSFDVQQWWWCRGGNIGG